MEFAILRAAGYALVHTPDMIEHNGTTQTTEKIVNPNSEYIKSLYANLRTFDQVVNYAPNQTYIGNMTPGELKKIEQPWYDKPVDGSRNGKFGEIMPQIEFYGLLQISDAFDLVCFERDFAKKIRQEIEQHSIFNSYLDSITEGFDTTHIKLKIENEKAQPLYYNQQIIGCILRAHDLDENLSAHVLFENLVVKASGILALKNLIVKNKINPLEIDFVIECSEEACGDMNQRGGGNFAKSIAEICGCINATGCDLRGFCAAPTHALVTAASLVQAKTYKNVVIVAGGSTAKLGMNGKSHASKGIQVLEDVLGAFAALISTNDGTHPIIRTDLIGTHKVSSGSSPQAVTSALISSPLDKANLSVHDIDVYSVEMQNPDITKPAGAGDVPESNLKMIAALGVLRKELEKKDIAHFVSEKALVGWAPTQGHIPSGVPYLGFAIDDLTTRDLNRALIVGKGSLFLGRMTNLFDGVSIVIERNTGELSESFDRVDIKKEIQITVAKALREFADAIKGV